MIFDRWRQAGENPMAYIDDVFRYAYARTGSREEAEDIAIKVVQALPNPCRRENLRTYMVGMAQRKVADYFRKHRRAELQTEETHDPTGSLDTVASVGMALDQLSQEHREVLILRFIVGLSSQETGSTLRKSAEAVDSLVQRAKAQFIGCWEDRTLEEIER